MRLEILHSTDFPSSVQLYKIKECLGVSAAEDADPRYRLLRRHGLHTLAYHTLQPELSYFFLEECGYLAFVETGNPLPVIHVLGDPVAHPDCLDELLARFLAHFPRADFVMITESLASRLQTRFGHFANSMGVETRVDVQDFSLAGSRLRYLRYFDNLRERGLVVAEEASTGLTFDQGLRGAAKEWADTRPLTRNELKFLVRRPVYDHEVDVRYGIVKWMGKICGFVAYDPIYHDGEIIGYGPSIQRVPKRAPKGALVCSNLHMIDKMRQEGLQTFSLGLSPFHHMLGRLQRSEFTQNAFRNLYLHGNWLFPFQGLAFNKSRYRGAEQQIYFASTREYPLRELVNLFRLVGVLKWRNLAAAASKALDGKN